MFKNLSTWFMNDPLVVNISAKGKQLSMPQNCKVFGCWNEATKETRDMGILYHKFPKNPDLREKWRVYIL